MEINHITPILVQPSSKEEQILLLSLFEKMKIDYNIENEDFINNSHKKNN